MKWYNIDSKGTAGSEGYISELTEQPRAIKTRYIAKKAVEEIK